MENLGHVNSDAIMWSREQFFKIMDRLKCVGGNLVRISRWD